VQNLATNWHEPTRRLTGYIGRRGDDPYLGNLGLPLMSRALVLTLVLVFSVEAKGYLSPPELFKPPSDPLSWEASECDDPTLDEPAWRVCLFRTGWR
jgi:hypothetical protein